MNNEEDLCHNYWGNSSSSGSKLPKKAFFNTQPFTGSILQPNQQKLEDLTLLDYDMRIGSPFQDFDPGEEDRQANKNHDWDPTAMLNNLSSLEQKVHQLQDLVHLIVGPSVQVLGGPADVLAEQRQLITADLTSIMVQLISNAGSLLQSVKLTPAVASPYSRQLGQVNGVLFPDGRDTNNIGPQMQNQSKIHDSEFCKPIDLAGNCKIYEKGIYVAGDNKLKHEEGTEEGENLLPGSYEILQLEKQEILAPHTHFCTICGKGFKRDANLRMHMRGHGDEYKSPAALANPNKESGTEPAFIKRYSCPFPGCKRNKDHKKFQPLKTILCVKNHYKRTHCEKSFTCSRCHAKKFSVIADLKTHEKHCGIKKWLCSCGTTFSRKDKLFGHITLFQGHTPAIPLEEAKATAGFSGQLESNEGKNKAGISDASTSSNVVQLDILDDKGSNDEPFSCFSPLNLDACNFGGFQEFPRPTYDDFESSFSLILAGASNFPSKNGEPMSNNL